MKTLTTKIINVLKRCWIPFAILLIGFAIFFSLFRALTPWVNQYKMGLENHLSVIVGHPVKIKRMETSWYWFKPVLKLDDISVVEGTHQSLKLNKLLVGINIFSSLWHWQIQPGILYIDDLDISLRRTDGQWQIDGLALQQQSMNITPETYWPVINWLIAQEKIVVRHAEVKVYVGKSLVLPIKTLNLVALKHKEKYHIEANATLAQTTPTTFSLRADVTHLDAYQFTGRLYTAFKDMLPAQWQKLVPNSDYCIRGGRGAVNAWLDFKNNQLTDVQSTLNFHHLSWQHIGRQKHYFLQKISANLGWKPTKTGWQLAGDRVKLRIDDVLWPTNEFLLTYQAQRDSYQIFAKRLLIRSLLTSDIEWPESMQAFLAIKPHGQLFNTHLSLHSRQLNYFSTRFENMGWQGNEKIPAVQHMGGVVNWQPEEGQFEVESKNLVVQPKEKPSVQFKQFYGLLSWKTLNQATRLHLDDLVIVHDDLIVNAQGLYDKYENAQKDTINLVANYAANNFEQWLGYIPSGYLKPKLEKWLKYNIKHVGKASGRLKLNGHWAEFPFVNTPGQFLVTNYLNDVDLVFANGWPMSRQVQAYVEFDKRTLQANIHYADLDGISVDALHLKIDDLGLDRETLLFHGRSNVDGNKMMTYLFNSPLKEKLAKLKMIGSIKGMLDLNLRLEIPLYPTNDPLLALGKVTFNNNEVLVKHSVQDTEFKDVGGTLAFDEHGIIDSDLDADILGDPFHIQIQSIRERPAYTKVVMDGQVSVRALKQKFEVPLLNLMEGRCQVKSVLKLTDNEQDMDQLQVSTHLQGVAIDLPEPFGKKAIVKTPLAVDVAFNPEKAIHLRFNYLDLLKSDLWFSHVKSQNFSSSSERAKKASHGKPTQTSSDCFELEKGMIRLGKGPTWLPKAEGVRLVGRLNDLNLQAWQKTLNRLSNDTSHSPMLNHFNMMDLAFDDLSYGAYHYPKVVVSGQRAADEVWHILLKQKDFLAHLQYHPKQFLLSGDFDYLNLPKLSWSDTKETSSQKEVSLNPEAIPNIYLRIGDLKSGDLQLGQVQLKSTSQPRLWTLDFCKIQSPTYELTLKGHWRKAEQTNRTDIQGFLRVNDLEKSLEQWKITPVVEAQHGEVRFRGHWPGAFYKFALEKLNGDMAIQFKDGRITHLSPETEEKIGLGKLLSILSLQTIPRRLKLDFSDLSSKGYSFDKFEGDFRLQKGIMNTKNSYIDGPVAYASMKGDLDLVKHLYDLDLHIVPHITASLPIVATIAGGPIAGIATWVASKIINQGMKKISGYHYKISGPWLDPVLQQVSITHQPEKQKKR